MWEYSKIKRNAITKAKLGARRRDKTQRRRGRTVTSANVGAYRNNKRDCDWPCGDSPKIPSQSDQILPTQMYGQHKGDDQWPCVMTPRSSASLMSEVKKSKEMPGIPPKKWRHVDELLLKAT